MYEVKMLNGTTKTVNDYNNLVWYIRQRSIVGYKKIK